MLSDKCYGFSGRQTKARGLIHETKVHQGICIILHSSEANYPVLRGRGSPTKEGRRSLVSVRLLTIFYRSLSSRGSALQIGRTYTKLKYYCECYRVIMAKLCELCPGLERPTGLAVEIRELTICRNGEGSSEASSRVRGYPPGKKLGRKSIGSPNTQKEVYERCSFI
jgi:hypothetical protein